MEITDLFGPTIPEKCHRAYGHYHKEKEQYIVKNSMSFYEYICNRGIRANSNDFIEDAIETFVQPVEFKKDRLDDHFNENEKKAYDMIQKFLESAYGKEKVNEIGRLRYWKNFHRNLEEKITAAKIGTDNGNKKSSNEGEVPDDSFDKFYRENFTDEDHDKIFDGLNKGIEKIEVRTKEWEAYHKKAEDAIQLLTDFILQRYHLPGFKTLTPSEIWRPYLERADVYTGHEHMYNILRIIYRGSVQPRERENNFNGAFEQLKEELFPYFFMLDNFSESKELCSEFFETFDDETTIEEFDFHDTLEEAINDVGTKQGAHILLCSILGLDVFDGDITKAFHIIYRTGSKTVKAIFDGTPKSLNFKPKKIKIVDGREVDSDHEIVEEERRKEYIFPDMCLNKTYSKGVSRLYSFAHQKIGNL